METIKINNGWCDFTDVYLDNKKVVRITLSQSKILCYAREVNIEDGKAEYKYSKKEQIEDTHEKFLIDADFFDVNNMYTVRLQKKITGKYRNDAKIFFQVISKTAEELTIELYTTELRLIKGVAKKKDNSLKLVG